MGYKSGACVMEGERRGLLDWEGDTGCLSWGREQGKERGWGLFRRGLLPFGTLALTYVLMLKGVMGKECLFIYFFGL